MANVLAIDIGGSKIAAGILRDSGQLDRVVSRPTPSREGGAAVLQAVIELCRPLLESPRPVAAGVGTAGQVDIASGTIQYSGDNILDWQGVPLGAELRAAFGMPVAVDNDVNAMALAELRLGAARGLQSALFITVGTGVGGGLIQQGALQHGSTFTAGEVCHLVIDFDGDRPCCCGENGHLESWCSGPAMERRYAVRAAPSELRHIAQRAREGEALAREVIAEGARILGTGLAGLLNVLDPEALVIGGGVAEIGPLWWEPLEAALRANPIPGPSRIPLHHAAFKKDAVLVGAGCLARDVCTEAMTLAETLLQIQGGLIVSCQALEGEPLHSPEIMARMAVAAQQAGAVAIRANSPVDIRAIKQAVQLPVIGLYKHQVDAVHITPTFEHARQVAEAGADIIALDGTPRKRGGESLEQILQRIAAELGTPVMADISTFEEGMQAAALGVDFIGTTLSGYTPYSRHGAGPDLELVARLAREQKKPVIAEGKISSPEEARAAMDAGAFAVVVGGAITRPQQIAQGFVDAL